MMKQVALVSHCVLNSYCESPEASDVFRRKIIDILLDKKISMIQLPCPELCFQALQRESILPDSQAADPYRSYCKSILEPVIKNLEEYEKHGIKIAGIIGIDTSPSCSAVDSQSIMMEILLEAMRERQIEWGELVDMPASSSGREFFQKLERW